MKDIVIERTSGFIKITTTDNVVFIPNGAPVNLKNSFDYSFEKTVFGQCIGVDFEFIFNHHDYTEEEYKIACMTSPTLPRKNGSEMTPDDAIALMDRIGDFPQLEESIYAQIARNRGNKFYNELIKEIELLNS